MTTKRPKVALGGRILTAGVAAGGTVGLTAMMQAQANKIDAQFLVETTTTSAAPSSTVPTVIVLPVTINGVVQQPTAVGVRPATPSKKVGAGATPTTQFSTGMPPVTTARPVSNGGPVTTQAPVTTAAPTTTQAPPATTTATSCTPVKHAKGWC